jgi:hypothetical protein
VTVGTKNDLRSVMCVTSTVSVCVVIKFQSVEFHCNHAAPRGYYNINAEYIVIIQIL